jgi:hypothetical protein
MEAGLGPVLEANKNILTKSTFKTIVTRGHEDSQQQGVKLQ